MSELVREVVKADIPQINKLLIAAGRKNTYESIDRLGGMTNHSYKVTLYDGEELLVRIPGDGTEQMINRLDEKKSTLLACQLGLDSELLYFGDDGTKVMSFIRNPQPMSEAVMQKRENILQAADIFRRLHYCGVDTGVQFEVFKMAALYERIIRKDGVELYTDYEDVKQTVMDIKSNIDMDGLSFKVPCHNDSLIGNWVLDEKGKLYLIDWEYSGMNEAMWDLSCLSIECNYSKEHDMQLLEAYYNRTPTKKEQKRFMAEKLYVDYLWALWGLARVLYDGKFMQDYAKNRYNRLKNNIKVFNMI